VSGHSRKRLNGSEAWSGRPRSGIGVESGCHKIGLNTERQIGRSVTLRSHALIYTRRESPGCPDSKHEKIDAEIKHYLLTILRCNGDADEN